MREEKNSWVNNLGPWIFGLVVAFLIGGFVGYWIKGWEIEQEAYRADFPRIESCPWWISATKPLGERMVGGYLRYEVWGSGGVTIGYCSSLSLDATSVLVSLDPKDPRKITKVNWCQGRKGQGREEIELKPVDFPDHPKKMAKVRDIVRRAEPLKRVLPRPTRAFRDTAKKSHFDIDRLLRQLHK